MTDVENFARVLTGVSTLLWLVVVAVQLPSFLRLAAGNCRNDDGWRSLSLFFGINAIGRNYMFATGVTLFAPHDVSDVVARIGLVLLSCATAAAALGITYMHRKI